jgi:galactokinase
LGELFRTNIQYFFEGFFVGNESFGSSDNPKGSKIVTSIGDLIDQIVMSSPDIPWRKKGEPTCSCFEVMGGLSRFGGAASCRVEVGKGHAEGPINMVAWDNQKDEMSQCVRLPEGQRFVVVDSGIEFGPDRQQALRRSLWAAEMGKMMILEKMFEIGEAAGRELMGDPMNGRLGNLSLDDYKQFFRGYLPESVLGGSFLERFGLVKARGMALEMEESYRVQGATDHQVHEAARVRGFLGFIQQVLAHPAGTKERGLALDKAGHLMYASQVSLSRDAMAGCGECELLVELVRRHEREGFYGAKMIDLGPRGLVAVLANRGERADAALAGIVGEYKRQTGREAVLVGGV